MRLNDPQLAELGRVCRDHGVVRLAVFGSRARGGGRPDSDLDLLVEFAPERAPGFFALARLAEDLSRVFGLATVDLRTPRDLSRHFRDEICRTAEDLYAA